MYLIDGYNVLKQVEYVTGIRLKQGKSSFIGFLKRRFPKSKFLVVFDGSSDVSYNTYNIHSAIKVIFSWDESADDVIRRIIKKRKDRGNIILVTDDRDLILSLKSYAVKISKVEEFLKKCYNKNQIKKESDKKPDILSLKGKKITNFFYEKLLEENKRNNNE